MIIMVFVYFCYVFFIFITLFQKSVGRIQCDNGETISMSMFKDCHIEIHSILELICNLFSPNMDLNIAGK